MILVTGSAGHLGEAVMRTLRAAGRPARGIDMKPSPYTDHVGSIDDESFVSRSLAGVRAVIHAATLHKPHVATHSARQFVATNVTGTLTLLEASVAAGVEAFVFTSTTSAFGSALVPADGAPAAWIDEDVVPVPKNIYGATKLAAEGLCEMFARSGALPVVILRTSRFFPEADDSPELRGRYDMANLQANEMLYRRVDLADAVDAHLIAVGRAPALGFGRYIVSATTPFSPDDPRSLRDDAAGVVEKLFADCAARYAARGWRLPESIDRVYVNARARSELGWRPRYDFRHVLDCLVKGEDFRSDLARAVGSKGYHDATFADGPYPVLR